MADIVSKLFLGFKDTITNLGEGCKSALTTFIFDNVDGTMVLSDSVQFLLVVAGISLAISVTLGCIRLIRNKI